MNKHTTKTSKKTNGKHGKQEVRATVAQTIPDSMDSDSPAQLASFLREAEANIERIVGLIVSAMDDDAYPANLDPDDEAEIRRLASSARGNVIAVRVSIETGRVSQ